MRCIFCGDNTLTFWNFLFGGSKCKLCEEESIIKHRKNFGIKREMIK